MHNANTLPLLSYFQRVKGVDLSKFVILKVLSRNMLYIHHHIKLKSKNQYVKIIINFINKDEIAFFIDVTKFIFGFFWIDNRLDSVL